MNRIRHRLGGEEGFVMAIAVMVLAITLMMAFAAMDEALSARSLNNRDGHVRHAQDAAEAGVQRQLYEQAEGNIDNWNLNGGPLGLSSTLDCLPVTLGASAQITGLASAAVNSAGVCPETSASSTATDVRALGNHESEDSEFIPGASTQFTTGAERIFWPKIVSLGSDTSGGRTVYSREEVYLQPIAALQAVEGMNNVTLNGLSALGIASAMVVNGDVVARNKVTLPTLYAAANLSSSPLLQATVTAPTVSGSVIAAVNNGSGTSKSQIPLRQAVSIAATKSSCPTGGCPTVTGGNAGDGYNSATNTFTLTKSTGSVTFASGDYVFCNFNVTAGTVNVNPTSSAPVRIMIDSPTSSRCSGNGLGSNQGNFYVQNGIDNLLSGTAAPSGLQIYVAGDGSYDDNTSVTIKNGSCAASCTALSTPIAQDMIVYAPTSSVSINTGVCLIKVGSICSSGIAGVFDGAVIGNDVSMTASTITQDLDLGNYPIYDGVQAFRPQQYVECSPQPVDTAGTTYTTLQHDPAIDTKGC